MLLTLMSNLNMFGPPTPPTPTQRIPEQPIGGSNDGGGGKRRRHTDKINVVDSEEENLIIGLSYWLIENS